MRLPGSLSIPSVALNSIEPTDWKDIATFTEIEKGANLSIKRLVTV